jgi:hypothetical protein
MRIARRSLAALAFLIVLGLNLGCSPKQYHIAQVSATSAHESLKFAEDTLDATVCGKPTAPAKCTPVETRRTLATTIAEGYRVDGQVSKIIYEWDPATGASPNYVGLLADITRVIQAIVDALPTPETKLKVAAVVNDKGGR